MKTKFFKQTLLGALVAVLASASQAGVLLGNGTYNIANDLTRIQTGSTTALDFLDLSVTRGMTPAAAVAAYGSFGFRWAGINDVSQLISAFGGTYAAASGVLTSVGSSTAQARLAVEYLGVTMSMPMAQGYFDDGDSIANTYVCFDCTNPMFVWMNSPFYAGRDTAGVLLVRDGTITAAGAGTEAGNSDVPEPGTLALAGLTLGLLAATRRRRA